MSSKIGHQHDTIHRTRRQAQLAAGAFMGNDRVHQLARAEYGIHRTDIDALAAADAKGFVYHGARPRFVLAVSRVQRFRREMQQRGQRLKSDIAARRTLVDIGGAGGERFGVGAATRVTALGTLRLRQPRIDLVNGNGRAHGRRVWPRFTIEATSVTVPYS